MLTETTQQKKSLKQYAEEYKQLEQEVRNLQSDQEAILEAVKEAHQVKAAAFKAAVLELMDGKSTQTIEKHKEFIDLAEGLGS